MPIFQLQFVGDLLVQVWCTYKCIFYSFSCNVIDVLIKHILPWLTKGIIYASNPPSVLRAKLLIFGLYNVVNGVTQKLTVPVNHNLIVGKNTSLDSI